MTTLQVHLLMLGLGILALLLLVGVFSSRAVHSRRRQRWLGALAGIAIAASPLSRYWRNPLNGIDLLTQSLLISAICLLALLLITLLRSPFKAMRRRFSNTREQAANTPLTARGLPPIVIDANSNDTVDLATHVTEDRSGATDKLAAVAPVTEDKSDALSQRADYSERAHPNIRKAQAFQPATYHDPLRTEQSIETQRNSNDDTTKKPDDIIADDAIDFADDQINTSKLDVSAIESVVPKHAEQNGHRRLDEKFSSATAANDKTTSNKISVAGPTDYSVNDDLSVDEELSTPTIPMEDEALDLSETAQLFAEIRSQQTEVELPDDKELRDAHQRSAIDELDLETELISERDVKATATQPATNEKSDAIEEAEVLDAEESNLEFGNDLTGEYAHPSAQPANAINFVDNNTAEQVRIPETLDDALIAAKVTAVSVQAQVSSLEDSIVELDGFRDEAINTANSQLDQQKTLLTQQHQLLSGEGEARSAAESVIAAQRALITRAQKQQELVDTLLLKERQRLSVLQAEIDRTRKMARNAANLARRAAVAQQEIRNVAKREQTARLKSQESTRKAVTIARNAISALAAEERKRGVTRH